MTKSKFPQMDPGQVTDADLVRLPLVHDVLSVLNDPRASAGAIGRYVERFPALKARVAERFRRSFVTTALPSLSEQIARIGNRAFESVLLELLEDLTVLRMDVEERAATRASYPPGERVPKRA